MPSRRALLGTVGALASSGCLLFMSAERCFEMGTEDADPVEIYLDSLPQYSGTGYDDVISNAPQPTPKERRFRVDGHFRYEPEGGDVYRIDVVDTRTETRTELEVILRRVTDRSDLETTSISRFAELPAVDQTALEAPFSELSPSETGAADSTEQEATVTYPDGTDDSQIAKQEQSWVEWQGELYRVTVGAEREDEQTLYIHEARRMSESDLREYLESEYLIRFEEFSDAERDVLRAAVDDGYGNCRDVDSGLREEEERLEERLTDDRQFPGEWLWYVEVDGQRYLLTYVIGISE